MSHYLWCDVEELNSSLFELLSYVSGIPADERNPKSGRLVKRHKVWLIWYYRVSKTYNG